MEIEDKKIKNGTKIVIVSLSVILALLILAIFFFILFKSSKKTTNNKPMKSNLGQHKSAVKEKRTSVKVSEVNESLKIVPKDDLSDFAPAYPKKLSLILTMSDGRTKDVTEEADWGSDNKKVASVLNSKGHKGEMNGIEAGEATVFAQYDGKGATLKVVSKNPELKVSCSIDKKTAKVGEEIHWVIIFNKMGVPRYPLYEIAGDDGLNANTPSTTFSFSKPGVKHSYVKAKDMVGQEAKADCPVITITK